MSGPAPRLNPVPPGGSLLRQFATMLLLLIALAISLTFLFVQTPPAPLQQHATIVLVWSGMRPDMVTANLTPNLLALGDRGVTALDHHSAPLMLPLAPAAENTTAAQQAPTATPTLTPTLTPVPSPTASAPTPSANGLPALPLLAQAALSQGLDVSYEGSGAAELTQAASARALLLDDQAAYPADLLQRLQRSGVTFPVAPTVPDAAHASGSQEGAAFTQAYLRVMLPALQASNTPFFSVIAYPDPAQTAATSGVGSLGMLDAIRADDSYLGAIEDGLRQANLQDSVNIVVTSDHGLVDVIPPGMTSAAALRGPGPDAAARTDSATLIALAAAQGASGILPSVGPQGVSSGPLNAATTVLVAAGGGMDAITLPDTPAVRAVGKGDLAAGQQQLAHELITWLQQQAQVGPIFVNDRLGKPDGTLPLSNITDVSASSPDIAFSFVANAQDVGQAATNALRFAGSAYADTSDLATWGTLSRHDLHTILFAAGPSFKSGGIRDLAPTSGEDLGPTLARVLDVTLPAGQEGRTINEILSDGDDVADTTATNHLDSTRALSADGKTAFVETLVTEEFDGNTYIQGAYAIHADAAADVTALLNQAHDLAVQE